MIKGAENFLAGETKFKNFFDKMALSTNANFCALDKSLIRKLSEDQKNKNDGLLDKI